MGDPSKFANIYEFRAYHIMLFIMVLAELFILIYTNGQQINRFFNNKRQGVVSKKVHKDAGTRWLLVLNFVLSIEFSFYFVSRSVPETIRNYRLPEIVTIMGILSMAAGVILRLIAVLTLKRAFTLTVQTTEEQHLIQTGLYRKLRNPSYTGSILSLIGAAVGLRNVLGILVVCILNIICYSIRIQKEEKALQARFQDEFITYKKHSYRLIPYLW